MANCSDCTNKGSLGHRYPFEWEFDFPDQMIVTIDNITSENSVYCTGLDSLFFPNAQSIIDVATDGYFDKCSNNTNTTYCPPFNNILGSHGTIGSDCNFNVDCSTTCDGYLGSYILDRFTPDSITHPEGTYGYEGDFILGDMFTITNPYYGTTSRNFAVKRHIKIRLLFPATPMYTSYLQIVFIDDHLMCWYERFGYTLKYLYDGRPILGALGYPGLTVYNDGSTWSGSPDSSNPLRGIGTYIEPEFDSISIVSGYGATTPGTLYKFPNFMKFDPLIENTFVRGTKETYCTIPSVSVTGA